jgi:catalase
MLLGMGAVGAFLVVDVGAVAYANKLVGAGNVLTPRAFIEGFRAVFGLHPGFRRNHAKGVAVTGYFDSNGNGRELSKAAGRRRAASRWPSHSPRPHSGARPC